MYSALFAMTVIIVIAITNLFLGFATAVLMGRGPKRWSDAESAIVLRPVVLHGLRRAPRPTVERVGTTVSVDTESRESFGDVAAPRDPEPTPHQEDLPPTDSAPDEMPSEAEPELDAPAAPQSEPDPVPRKLVLPPRDPVSDTSDDPPDKILNQQIEAWRHGDLSEETPSVSGLRIDVSDEVDETLRTALADAVFQRIRKQVRKDRRVLRVAPDQFAWFSCDVTPDDALMPVERIRQMLGKTRFHRDESSIEVNIVGAVVAGQPEDDADAVIQRLAAVFDYANANQELASCLDVGHGPQRIEPHQFEVEETDCAV